MSDQPNEPTPEEILDIVKACCQALDDKKAGQLRVLHVGPKSSIADYFVIATGNSNPHLRALRNILEKTLDERKVPILGSQMDPESGWLVLDAYEIIFHLFTQEMRDHYALENLWKDVEEVSLEDVLKAG